MPTPSSAGRRRAFVRRAWASPGRCSVTIGPGISAVDCTRPGSRPENRRPSWHSISSAVRRGPLTHPGSRSGASHSAADLAEWAEASGAAFDRDDRWRIERYAQRLADPAVGLFFARADGRPVAAARIELPPARSIATLWGGGTLPAYRGRGIYRLLVAARGEEARRRGYRYLTVEARSTSRPILARVGFVELTEITEWTLSPSPG